MTESQVEELNKLIDDLFTRFGHEIKHAPYEALPSISQSLLYFKDFTNAMESSQHNQMQQDRMMRAVKKKIDDGDFGFGIIDPNQK